MKLKLAVAGVIIATSLAVVGPSQAMSMKHKSHLGTGWHMVSKQAGYHPADNWQEYTSGGYLQPMGSNKLTPFF